jgi:mRNA-degrading endonuclease RelE of RelBE toxin-antitoxin system
MYQIFFHPQVKKDISKISKKELSIIKRTIDNKIAIDPEIFGKPLRHGLKKYRTTRISNYRIIFKVSRRSVYILAIGHRKNIYENILNRKS